MRPWVWVPLCSVVVLSTHAGAYQRPQPRAAPPVALTSSDGAGLRIVRFEARGVVEDPLAFTELHLTFRNPEQRVIEGQFEITLPPNAAVSRFAMKQAWGWQEGEVVELQAAREAYEDFLHRRQDPALLEKAAGNQFHARVFPIPAGGEKEIILSYSQELPRAEDRYKIFLRGLPKVDALDIKVFLGKRTIQRAQTTLGGSTMSHEVVEVRKQDFTPDVDFEVTPPASDGGERLGLRHENLTVARITPVTDAAPDRVENLLVLFDSSASRAPGYAAQLDRLRAVIGQVGQASGPQTPLAVACFDQEVAEIFDGTVLGFGDNQVAQIAERRALGASDLGRALRWVAAKKDRKWSRVLVVTDGIATAGPTEPQDLRKLTSTLGNAGVQRLDVLVSGGIRDEAMLKRLTTAGLSRDGVVLDDELPAGTIALRLASATFSGIKVTAPGASWVWPSQLDGVQPGDQVLVYADLPADKPLEIVLEGARAGRHPVRLAEVARPLLERAWVNARIQRLQQQRETLAASDPDLRAALKKQIIEISTKYRVLCDFTALLVLETEEDYARFHIDRRALSDILVVGPTGIELEHRGERTPVFARPTIPDPVQQQPPRKTPAPTSTPPQEEQREQEDLGFYRYRGRDGKGKAKKSASEAPSHAHRSQRHEGGGDDMKLVNPDFGWGSSAPPGAPSGAPTARVEAPPPPLAPMPADKPAEVSRPSRQPPRPEPKPAPTTVARPPRGDSNANNDRDGDGIPDATDRCPNEPETFNGYEDQDGCPDRGRLIVTESRIQIIEKIYFPSGKATLNPVQLPILDAMAATLRGNPELVMIEVQGHGDEHEDTRVADARAQAVRNYLVAHNVAAGRLLARSYGRERPLCGEHNDTCWAKNRRVELTILARSDGRSPEARREPPKPPEVVPYEGRLLEVMTALKNQKVAEATQLALRWRDEDAGDVLALIAVGEAWEAGGKKRLAARAYGSIIDLFPGRADLRRFAGERLERLGELGSELAIDTYRQAREQRADHPASHRLLAFALLREGKLPEAFDAILAGVRQPYPSGRFAGVDRILREDAGLIAAAWIHREPARRAELAQRLASVGTQLPEGRSLRFVLNWETDANDVDFHIYDAQGGHAYYQSRTLPTGGELYADVTTGYGPECFTISGDPAAYPYRLQAHYYSRGPMGYGMGKLEVIEHDGQGNLSFDERPFVIMTNSAFVELGQVQGPLGKAKKKN